MTIDSPLVSHEDYTVIQDATLQLDVAGVIHWDQGTFFNVISASSAGTGDTDTAASIAEQFGNNISYKVQRQGTCPISDEFYTLKPQFSDSEPHVISELSIKGDALTAIQQITRVAGSNAKTRDTISGDLRRTVKHIVSGKESSI